MQRWTVEVLNNEVAGQIDAWPLQLRAALTRIIDRVESLGLDRIGEPHVRRLDGKLWEMRPSGKRTEGRALYVTATGRRAVIVLAFVKKTKKTPGRIVKLAHDRARSIGL